jgi:hypothetical protein
MNIHEMEDEERIPATKVSDRIHDAARKQREKELRDALKRIGAKKAAPTKIGNALENRGDAKHGSVEESLEYMNNLFLEKVTQILEAGMAPKQDDSSNMISPDVKATGKTPVVVGKNGDGIDTRQYAAAQGVS